MARPVELSTPRKTILMVEDQPQVRRLVYHALKSRYRVIEAGDADSAIALLDQEQIDLVVLDLHLPPDLETPGEGLRVRDEIRAHLRDLPVVVATGNESPAVRQTLLSGGVRKILSKPLDVSELVSIVGGLLGEGA